MTYTETGTLRKHKLLTKEMRKTIPPLYSQDGAGDDATVHAKFFGILGGLSGWTWYATEGSPVLDDDGNEVDFEFFGLVNGYYDELGYFRLSELDDAAYGATPAVERDLHFQPVTMGEVRAAIERGTPI